MKATAEMGNILAESGSQIEFPTNEPWLSGWKAIGAFTGYSVSKCKLMHKKFGMPVHYDDAGSPIAFPSELRAWLISREQKKRVQL